MKTTFAGIVFERAIAVPVSVVAIGLTVLLNGLTLADPWPGEFESSIQEYRETNPSGAVFQLQKQLKAGELKLTFESQHGYLLSLLERLKVPPESQILVASKTSPNRDFISPKNPRALYFNDHISIAYVPGAPLIEITAQDPKLGIVFYTLDQKPEPIPKLVRDDRCLECHASSKTLNVPGLLARSFLTKPDGEVDLLSGLLVTHRTPIADRWGGYYVTGDSGNHPHRGNGFSTCTENEKGAENHDLAMLDFILDVKKYPQNRSDIVALMLLEHQVHMQNLLTRINFESREALKQNRMRSVYPAFEAALKYLLFTEEYPLHGEIRGNPAFISAFEKVGPVDDKKRSLRQFQLQTRLFKYRCSYMIYSDAFDSLIPEAKKHFYRRLWDILSGQDTSTEFQSLGPEDRQAIREILISTKKDLPQYWGL